MDLRILKEMREKRGYTVRELSKASGVSSSVISRIESGENNNPTTQSLQALAKTLNFDVTSFFKTYDGKNKTYLPILGYATAGLLEEQFQQHLGYVTVPEKYSNQNKYMAVKVIGDSMNRYIHDGSIAVFEKYPATINNKIVLVEVNNETTIKRFHDYDTLIMLDPDSTNPIHRPIVIKKENENTIKVYGRLVYFCKEED